MTQKTDPTETKYGAVVVVIMVDVRHRREGGRQGVRKVPQGVRKVQ